VILAEVWNGTTWSVQSTPKPSGAFFSVLDGVSCSSATACTPVGYYDNSSFTQFTLAEAWNGSAWTIVTTPDPTGATTSLLSGVSCRSATACTAVGYYTSSSYTNLTLAEEWSGSAWTIKSTGGNGGSSKLYGVSCSSAKACLAVGYYTGGGEVLAVSAMWNGSAWSIADIDGPAGTTTSDLNGVSCSSASDCTAVGSYESGSGTELTLAEAWNGGAHGIQSTPNATGTGPADGLLYSVSCHSAKACTAVGYYYNTSGTEVTLAEAWNGTSWSIQKTPNPAGATAPGSVLDAVSCSSATACTAVGYYNIGSETSVKLAEAWNGHGWTIQKTPSPKGALDSYLSGVSCSSAKDCTAVGSYFSARTGNVTIVEAWNGTAWKVQATPSPAHDDGSYLVGVSCLSVRDCTAVGYYFYSFKSSHAELTLAEAWNGTAWNVQVTPSPAGTTEGKESDLEGVSCPSATACNASGYYWKNSSQAYVILTEAWNGTAWKVQSTPKLAVHSESEAATAPLDGVSCSSATACTAAGYYENSAGEVVTLAEAWNGTAWSIQKTPSPEASVLYGVSCPSATACTAVGSVEDNGTEVTLAEAHS
jgi:hypothetical protein